METKRAKAIAEDLMTWHGLTQWRFAFDSSVRRFGYCSPRRLLISLSKNLTALNSETEVINTILHEIAHALVPLDNHGEAWKRVAVDIGCSGDRCYSDKVITPTPSFSGECPGCHRIVKRFRRKRIACGVCCKGVFNPAYLIQWR